MWDNVDDILHITGGMICDLIMRTVFTYTLAEKNTYIVNTYHDLIYARGCNEKCNCFETIEKFANKNNLYTEEEVLTVMYEANRDGVNGYTDIIIQDYI